MDTAVLSEYCSVMFFPRRFIPHNYVVIKDKINDGKVIFTYVVHKCKTGKTKQTIVFFHGNGEIVEVCY